MPVQQLRNVAIFLDMENLFGGYGKDVAAVPLAQLMGDIEAEVVRSGLGGTTALVRAYANWARPDMAVYKKTPAAKTPPVTKAPAPKKRLAAQKTAADHPELKLYQASVHDFVKKDPTLWINGQVNAQRLGTLLRKRWAEVTYKTFGFATLTRFVEESCGLKTVRPTAAVGSK